MGTLHPNHRRVTLNDVAAQAGVSYMTVSRVVNNKGEISEKTRQRVLQAIQELGYRPNVVARSLAAGRTCTIGVVTVELYRFAPSRMATGIQQRCQELGYLLLVEWMGSPDDPLPHLDALAGRQVDAIIWLGSERDGATSWANPDLLADLPPVVFCEVNPQPGLHVVTIENRIPAAELTRHLLAQGRREIGIITGPLNRAVPRDRLAGWQDALREAGLEPSPSLIAQGDWSAASGERGFHELIERHPRLDAILASNDRMALGALSAAHAAGRLVPADVAVAGFDNIPEAAYFIPPLTTVQQPLLEVGQASADLAIRLAEARRAGSPHSGRIVVAFALRADRARQHGRRLRRWRQPSTLTPYCSCNGGTHVSEEARSSRILEERRYLDRRPRGLGSGRVAPTPATPAPAGKASRCRAQAAAANGRPRRFSGGRRSPRSIRSRS